MQDQPVMRVALELGRHVVLDRALDLGPLGEHGLPVRRADVVQVDVHRQSREIADEQIDGCAAFESEAFFFRDVGHRSQ